jgi:hypothetical protein
VAEVTISVGPDPAAAAAQPGPPPAPPGPAGPFRILEIRGRTISADANFKISTGEESAPDDVELSFDKLVPAPADEQKIKKPLVAFKFTVPESAETGLTMGALQERTAKAFDDTNLS